MIIAWIVVGYLLLFIPIVEYASYRNYKKQIADNTFRKQSFYNSAFVELWTPVICLIVLVIIGELKAQHLGFTRVVFNAFSIDWLLFIGSIILAVIPVLILLLTIYQYIGIRTNNDFRNAYMAAVKKKETRDNHYSEILGAILPKSKQEKIQWIFISITAGITEEILFRGFLVYWINVNFPNIPIPYLLLLQAIPFSLMHLYQGIRGVLTTFLMGIVFGVYVIVFGSIIPCIIIHIFVDLSVNLMEREQIVFLNERNV